MQLAQTRPFYYFSLLLDPFGPGSAQNFEEGITVTKDDYTAGKTMGSFMGSRVHGKIAYLGVDEEDEAVGIFRRQGVLEGIKESGSQVMTVETGDYSYASGQEMMEKVLEKGLPDGVICATDRLAFGAYRILQKHGILIPEQVSVAGFGGYDESELLSPQLTTLRFDSYGLGYLGAETLLGPVLPCLFPVYFTVFSFLTLFPGIISKPTICFFGTGSSLIILRRVSAPR